MTPGLALLAALANALSSVLQRKANRDEPQQEGLSWRLIWGLLHRPVWFAGMLAVIAGFLLQVAALRGGDLATVQPTLTLELPVTLIVAARVFHSRLHAREWGSAATMTVGLICFIYFLAPSSGRSAGVGWLTWSLGVGVNLAAICAAVWWAYAKGRGAHRAASLGVATGCGFGLTAALMKAMTTQLAQGLVGIFTHWQLYAMVAAGAMSMFLAQAAMNAGRLIAAQPGFTLADPVVATLWGPLAFHEQVHHGVFLVGVAAGVSLMAGAVVVLSRSPMLADEASEQNEGRLRGRQSGEDRRRS